MSDAPQPSPGGPRIQGLEDLSRLVAEVDQGRQKGTRARRPRRSLREATDLKAIYRGWRDRLVGTPERRARTRRWTLRVGPPLVLAIGVGLFLAFKPPSKPDFERDNLRRVLDYALLTDQFNRLPVEERIRLVGQLAQRFQNMSSGDSALMAAFAAGIAGKAREQVEQNASRLMIDLWDKYAVDYARVPVEERGAFLERALLEMTRLGEAFGARPDTRSDQERLAEARRQAQRDEQNLREGRNAPPARAQGRIIHFLRENVASHAAPAQRARGQLMLRDMTLYLRGEGIGRP